MRPLSILLQKEDTMSQPRSTRRRFLKRSAAALAAGAAAPYVWTNLSANAEPRNERLNVAAIGTSIYRDRWGRKGSFDGRGSVVGHQAGVLGNMVACCDVNTVHAEHFAAHYDGRCQVYTDFRKLLERNDIDAITIGTPDHWHTTIAIAACKAGKDVYCEKPLTLTINEGRQIAHVVKETGRVFQVGTQQRSEYDQIFLKAVALARSGRLGKKLTALSSVGQPDFVANKSGDGPFEDTPSPKELNWDFWLGQAPRVPYCIPRCDYDFRWWLEYSGGQMTDWGVHHTDIALWALGGEETGVVDVEGKGDFPVFSSGEVDAVDFLNGRVRLPNRYNVAHSFDCQLGLPNGNSINLVSGQNELIISGEKGRIRVNRGGLTGKPVEELTEKDNEWLDQEIVKLCGGKKPGNHMANFFECVKDRSLPISDVFSHLNSVNACHMANIALLRGCKVRWDPTAQDFIGDKVASAMRGREQRKEYSIEKMT